MHRSRSRLIHDGTLIKTVFSCCIRFAYFRWLLSSGASCPKRRHVDGKDKYRTTGMASRGGTPTVPAMKYMGKKLMKDSIEKKILIVSTDGCSGRGYGETVRDVIKKLQHDGVMIIGAGIGDSKPRIQEEFGSNFLDISNLDAMPKILCNIVKKNLA